MGSHRAQPAEPPRSGGTSRRQLREAEQRSTVSTLRVRLVPSSAPAASRVAGSAAGRWTARAGVLVALAGVTVVVPVAQESQARSSAQAEEVLTDSTLPGTVEALTSAPVTVLPPSSLLSADATAVRSTVAASRSTEREALPGCDGVAREGGANGLIDPADLCTLWDGNVKLRADAAVALAELNQAFVARFGTDLCLSSGYRTLAEQRSVKAQKGGLAAAPGRSNHGWGLAIDFCQTETSGDKWTWLGENGRAYGLENPDWAKPGGGGPYERWHWEYTKGVKADGEYYGS
ncbi:M15 family metallopeptidase [Cellulomonas hominis]